MNINQMQQSQQELRPIKEAPYQSEKPFLQRKKKSFFAIIILVFISIIYIITFIITGYVENGQSFFPKHCNKASDCSGNLWCYIKEKDTEEIKKETYLKEGYTGRCKLLKNCVSPLVIGEEGVVGRLMAGCYPEDISQIEHISKISNYVLIGILLVSFIISIYSLASYILMRILIQRDKLQEEKKSVMTKSIYKHKKVMTYSMIIFIALLFVILFMYYFLWLPPFGV